MVKLFNLDLHVSVIEDFINIMNKLYGKNVSITNWSISGPNVIFKKPNINVDIINNNTWKRINTDLINKFVDTYFDFLSQFDGFVVTHSPVFCLLYEKFNKPIILINSTRYEQPFSWTNNIDAWDNLNKKLKCLADKKQLIAISNNKADQEYLKLGTGINSILIPSLCLYTNLKYNPIRSECIIYNDNGSNILETKDLKNKKNVLKNNYPWKDLYGFKGIVHMPYEISTMSIFEQYSANIPLFFPSKDFLKFLITNERYYFQSRYNKINNYNNKYHPLLEKALDDSNWVDFWIDKSDFYDQENMKHIIYFDSYQDLNDKINKTDFNAVSQLMKEHNTIRMNNVYQMWDNIIRNIYNI